MALKKHQAQKPRATHAPGETDREWTARNARLERNATGRWVIKLTEKQVNDGKPDHRSKTLSTKETDLAAAKDVLSRWREAYVAAMEDEAPRPTFRDVADTYKSTRSKRYTDANDLVAGRLCEFLGDDPADTIQERRMDELHNWLVKSGRAPGTVRNYLSVALTLLNYAERQGMIPRNSAPKYKLPPIPPSPQHTLSEADRARVFAAAAAWGQDTGDPVKTRIGLFVCIALETAARRDAILDLTWDRINLTDTVRGALQARKIDFRKPGHTPANKVRCPAALISPDLMAVLRRAAPPGEQTGPVFSRTNIIRGFHAFRDMLNMPDWFTPHMFRHTWVTLAWEAGIAIQYISHMTGDTVPTLQRTYAHLNADVLEQKFNEILWSKRNIHTEKQAA